MEKYKILVELDAILDTRFSTLHRLVPDELESIILAGYRDRLYDRNIGSLDYDDYVREYNSRDKTVLLNAIVTDIPRLLFKKIAEIIHGSLETPTQLIPELIISYYPYDLTTDEIELIKDNIHQMITSLEMDIKMVNLSYTDISPSYLRSNQINSLILYGGEKWLAEQFEGDTFGPDRACVSTELIMPMLITAKIPDNKTVKDVLSVRTGPDNLNPFEYAELFNSAFINLKYHNTELFSAVVLPSSRSQDHQ